MPLNVTVQENAESSEFPEVLGSLEYDEKSDQIVMRFDASKVSDAGKSRPYVDKKGESKTTNTFKIHAAGTIAGVFYELKTTHRGSVSLQGRKL